MDTLQKADVFFFLTSIAVVVVSVLLAIAFYYFIKILRDIKAITEMAKEEGEILAEELSQLRASIKEEGGKIKGFLNFLKFFNNIQKEGTKHKKKKSR